MQRIRLNKAEWSFDETKLLGPPGGFGDVFQGSSSEGDVAVKRLKLSAAAAAHRELNIGGKLADRRLKHVVPILDNGQDAETDRYYLVMPICQESLQDYIDRRGAIAPTEALQIATHVISGLLEVDDIVHRDLKPGNVLLYQGRWSLADFGIAKFVEDSTSLQTLRGSLTPAYGAPEQWKNERPTHATDVYALGCILHTMITGEPLFSGSAEDIREKHLLSSPPTIESLDPRFATFVSLMLRKAHGARPSLARCLQVIGSTGEKATSERRRNTHLQAASAAVASANAEKEAQIEQFDAYAKQRRELADEAQVILQDLKAQLLDQIRYEVGEEIEVTAGPSRTSNDFSSIKLGGGTLDIGIVERMSIQPPVPRATGSRAPWDICVHAPIGVLCSVRSSPNDGGMGGPQIVMINDYRYSSNLLYCSTPDDEDFRWREINFFSLGGGHHEPCWLPPSSHDFKTAISPIVGLRQIAFGPAPIDGEDAEAFVDRWLTLFGKAAHGRLTRPNPLPVQPQYFM